MTRRRIALAFLALAGLAGAAALLVLAPRDRGEDRDLRPAPEIQAEGTLSPRITLFGDTLVARLDVTLDSRRVDPDSVRVSAEFTPWLLLRSPDRTQRDGKTTTHIRTIYVLRCLTGPCIPPRETAPLQFDPARVTFTRRGAASRQTLEVVWPLLVVHSRLVAEDDQTQSPTDPSVPWRADVLTLPAVSYRASPRLVAGLFLGGGVLFALAGAVLVFLAFPRRAEAPPPPEEPALPPLTALEQALQLLEDPARANGAADQRRALELVAEELAERDPQIARAASALAWSEDVPAVTETSGLAGRVRDVLGEELDGDVD